MSGPEAQVGATAAPLQPINSSRAVGVAIPAFGGLVAMVAITVGATIAGSPFDVHQAGAWMFGMGHHTMTIRRVAGVAAITGVAALLVAWLLLLSSVRDRPGTRIRTIAAVFVLWALPVLIAPPLFSQDAYSYTAQGEMVARGINPYDHGPVSLTQKDPEAVKLVDTLWLRTPAPYGPLYLGLDAGVVELGGHDEAASVEGLRLLALTGIALGGAFLPSLARRSGTSPPLALSFAVLNPLTLLGLLAPGHNDALMVGLVVAAVALSRQRRPVLAVAVCTLAVAVKAPAIVAMAFIALDWMHQEPTWGRRCRALAETVLVAFGLMEALSLITGLSWGWVGALGTPGVVRSVITPTTDVALLAAELVRALGLRASTTALIGLARSLGYLATAGISGWLLWRGRRVGMLLALALSLLVVVALGPVFQPWYLAWGLFCLAPVAVGRWRVLLIAVSIFGTIAALPRFEPLVASAGLLGDAFGLIVGLALVLAISPRCVAWARQLGWSPLS